MTTYRITAPNGKTYEIEGPPGASQAEVIQAVLAQSPEAGQPPSTDRTFGEATTDVGAALLRGTGQALQFPGQLVGLVPGMQGLGEALATPGGALAEYGQGLKSAGLRAREALRNQALSDAEKEGFLAEFATAIGQTIKDPALLSTFLLEQVPQLIGPAAAAKVTTMLGREGLQAVAEGGAREAAERALRGRAAAAAVGTGAAAQGASIGDETYKAVYELALQQGMSEEDARALALEKARIAAIEAGVISVATSRLPGGAAIERRLAGLPGVPGAGRIGVGAREALTEGLEEAGGAFAKGVGVAEVDPSISPLTGVGTAAGFGVIGGAGLGTVIGGRPTAEQRAASEAEAPAKIDRLKREAAEKAQAEERARAEPVNRAQAVIGETEGLPIGEAFPRLTREIEALRQQPKSSERDEAIKALTEERRRRQTEDAEQLIEGKRAAQGFMTAEEAGAAGVVPRGEFDAAQAEIEDLTRRRDALLVKGKPPAPKSPARRQFNELDARIRELGGTAPTAPTAPTGAEAPPEPTVRGPKPLPEVLDSETVKTIGFVRGKIHDALVGKSITDPEVRAILEGYKQGKNASTKTVAKIDAFLGRLPEPAATPPVPETPAAEAVTPTETPAIRGYHGSPTKFSRFEKKVEGELGDGYYFTFDPKSAQNWGARKTMTDEEGRLISPEKRAPVYVYETDLNLSNPASFKDVEKVKREIGKNWTPAQVTEALKNKGFDGVVSKEDNEIVVFDSGKIRILGGPSATTTEPATGGAGVPVATEPDTVGTPGGAGVVEPTGVVPPAPDAGQPVVGEGEQPGAVAEAPSAFGAMARDVEKAKLTYSKADEDILLAQLREVKADIKALKTAQKNLRTPQGAVLEEDREAFDEAQGQIDQLAEQQKALDSQLTALRRTKPKKEEAVPVKRADLGINYFADPSEQVADLEREIDQAVGAYNNPRSDTKRRQVSTDYLFRLAKDATVPEEIRTRAKEALAFAVDPRDLRDNQRDDYAALTKDVKDTGKEWEAMRFTKLSKGFYPESEPEELQRLEQALTGKSLVEVADYMAGYFKVGDQKLIAKRVAERIKSLQAAGYDFDFKIVNTGDPAPTIIASGAARGIAHLTYPNNKPKSTVYLRGAGMDSTGMHPRIILHELVHAAAVGAMNVGKLPGAKGSAPAKIYDDLRTVFNAFIDHYNKRATAYRSGRGQLNEVELAIYKGEVNAAKDPDELLAWGLTSPKFQEYLESIPFKGRNLWTQFVDSIRGFLGLAPRADTVLSEVLHVADDILTSDPKNELSLVAALGAPSVQAPAVAVGKKEEGTLGDYFTRTFGARKTIGLRVQTTDSLGSVEAKLGEAYGEKIRDMLGNMNPVVLLSRALDAVRFAAEMLNVGKMVVDPSGMTRLTTLSHNGQNISYASVMRDVKAEAERRGMTGEAFVGEIGEVLAGRREYELMRTPDAASLEFFLTPQEAQAANNRFNNDAFIKDVSEKLDAIRFAGIDLLVATGRIPESKAKEWKDATGYIPFKRIDEMDKLYADRGGGVPSDLKLAAFKGMGKFTGSDERQTENPLQNFVSLMEWMTREGMKAEAVGRALNDMVLIGAAKRVPTAQAVADNQKGAVVPSWENGQQKFYLVPDPADLAAFAGFKASSVAGPIKAMQQVSKVLRIGVTATPAFAIKQVFDDITRAYVHSGVKNPAALVPRMMLEMPKAWWAEVRGLRTPGMEMLARHGVVPTYDTIEGGNVRNIFEETGISKRSMSKAILRIIEAGAKASDIATRQAIFDQTMKETGDVDLAEQRAREIINFSRKGASSTADFFIRTVPFFNAYARSMDKLLLAAAGNPAMQKTLGMSTGYARNLFFKRMTVLTAAGLAYAMLMSDDEDYQDLSDNVRDRNWVLPYGKELGFTPVIPLPAELAFFFKAIPERVVQYVKLQGTPEERDALRVAKEMLLAGVDLFWTPNLTPQLVKPFYENLVNYSFFLGRPLESQAQLALDPSKRYGTSTSEAIKAGTAALSEAGIEISPIMVENAVRGVLGMSAGLAISVADALVNPSRTDRPLHQQIIPQLTGASALMKDPVGNRFLDDIYDLDKKVEQAYNTYKKEEKDDPEKANAYYLRTFGLQSIREEMKGVMNAIREMNAQSRAIDKMTDIPSEERAQLIADLKSQQNELARISYALRRRAALAQMEADRQ